MEDDDAVQDLPDEESFEEENGMEFPDDPEVVNEEAEESQEDEKVEIFNSFRKWLQTADGGRKDGKMAKQHSSQLRNILVTIDPAENLSSLFNKSLIRDKFLRDNPEK